MLWPGVDDECRYSALLELSEISAIPIRGKCLHDRVGDDTVVHDEKAVNALQRFDKAIPVGWAVDAFVEVGEIDFTEVMSGCVKEFALFADVFDLWGDCRIGLRPVDKVDRFW